MSPTDPGGRSLETSSSSASASNSPRQLGPTSRPPPARTRSASSASRACPVVPGADGHDGPRTRRQRIVDRRVQRGLGHADHDELDRLAQLAQGAQHRTAEHRLGPVVDEVHGAAVLAAQGAQSEPVPPLGRVVGGADDRDRGRREQALQAVGHGPASSTAACSAPGSQPSSAAAPARAMATKCSGVWPGLLEREVHRQARGEGGQPLGRRLGVGGREFPALGAEPHDRGDRLLPAAAEGALGQPQLGMATGVDPQIHPQHPVGGARTGDQPGQPPAGAGQRARARGPDRRRRPRSASSIAAWNSSCLVPK